MVLAARAAYPDRHLKSIRERDNHLMEAKINLIKHLFRKKFSEKQVATVLKFIKYYVIFELKETSDTFERKLNVLNKNKSTMGLDEQIMIIHEMIGMDKGIKKGRRQLRTDLVRNLMVNHGYGAELTAELMKVSMTFVKRVMRIN